MTELTDEEKVLLDFAALPYRYNGARQEAIRDRFGVSTATFWARVNGLLDRPEAWAYAPATVKRLRRLREVQAVPLAVLRRNQGATRSPIC